MTTHRRITIKKALPVVAIGLSALLVAGCSGSSSSTSAGASTPVASIPAGATTPTGGTTRVLPMAKNPIANSATAPGLTITKALVENNVSAETGKAVSDHLEVALKNTNSAPLDGVEVYYVISDPSTKGSEGYYAKLAGFTIAPGATRIAHFDDTGAKDHFPVNKLSLYYTDKNALVVDVTASATGVKPATFTVKKDSGGAEAGVE
jgi:hypothetical protein